VSAQALAQVSGWARVPASAQVSVLASEPASVRARVSVRAWGLASVQGSARGMARAWAPVSVSYR